MNYLKRLSDYLYPKAYLQGFLGIFFGLANFKITTNLLQNHRQIKRFHKDQQSYSFDNQHPVNSSTRLLIFTTSQIKNKSGKRIPGVE